LRNKFFAVLVAVIICIISAVPAFSTASGGFFTQYDVIVSSESGAVLYDRVWNDDMTRSIMRPLTVLAPAGTQLVVTDEFEFEGTLYLAVTYGDFDAYIKKDKVLINVQQVGENAAYSTSASHSVVIINKNGAFLRKGPSLAYDTVSDAIPYATVITYNKTNSDFEPAAEWAYTEYNGVKGWLNINQYGSSYDCAKVLDENDCFTGILETLTDGAYLTENIDADSAKVAENIPSGTKLCYKYYYEFSDYICAFVEYNGVKGWLGTKGTPAKIATGEKGGVYVLAENGLPLYKKPFEKDAEHISVVPVNSNLSVDFAFSETAENSGYIWMHVNYNGTDGWIFSGDSSEYCYMYRAFDLKINAENGLDLYAAPNAESEVISTVPHGSNVTCIYEIADSSAYWSFVKYGDTHGWIYSTANEAVLIDGTEKYLDAPFGAQKIERESVSVAPEFESHPSTQPAEADKNNDFPKTHIIIGVCAAAIIIGIAAIVTIKKKKAK